ncbi:MAG: hypothetical protein K2X27_24105, partial [Candidatus Obscuribacterales bacterium]|nr:hypothetical protein [Candidatus Obscuribacterales bacterium]
MSPLAISDLKSTFTGKDRGFNGGGNKGGNGIRLMLLGVLCLMLLLGAAKMLGGKAQSNPEQVRVVAAGKDISPGSRLSFSSLHYLNLPRAYADKSMFYSYEQLKGKL